MGVCTCLRTRLACMSLGPRWCSLLKAKAGINTVVDFDFASQLAINREAQENSQA